MAARVELPLRAQTLPATASVAPRLARQAVPSLNPVPIAFLVNALVTDIAGIATGEPLFATCSWWLLACGVVATLVAAVAGLAALFDDHASPTSDVIRRFLAGNAAIVGLIAVNMLAHEAAAAPAWGLALSGTALVLLLLFDPPGETERPRPRVSRLQLRR